MQSNAASFLHASRCRPARPRPATRRQATLHELDDDLSICDESGLSQLRARPSTSRTFRRCEVSANGTGGAGSSFTTAARRSCAQLGGCDSPACVRRRALTRAAHPAASADKLLHGLLAVFTEKQLQRALAIVDQVCAPVC